jgi:NADPH-dependent F420 reductase
LAYRWAKAGYHVIIGSRTPEKAERVAADLNKMFDRNIVSGMSNQDSAINCDIAVITVPYSAHKDILESVRDQLQDKVVIDVTVPLDTKAITTVFVPPGGSASLEAQQILGDSVSVVAAFQNISHVHLQQDGPVPCDVLICGDSEGAKKQVLQLVEAAGMAGWDAGPLQNAIVVEGLTPLLLGINKRHKVKHAGIRITGHHGLGA